MTWTEQAIAAELDAMLASAIKRRHVSGWPKPKMSLNRVWEKDIEPSRTLKQKAAKALYMKTYLAKRLAKLAAASRAQA